MLSIKEFTSLRVRKYELESYFLQKTITLIYLFIHLHIHYFTELSNYIVRGKISNKMILHFGFYDSIGHIR